MRAESSVSMDWSDLDAATTMWLQVPLRAQSIVRLVSQNIFLLLYDAGGQMVGDLREA